MEALNICIDEEMKVRFKIRSGWELLHLPARSHYNFRYTSIWEPRNIELQEQGQASGRFALKCIRKIWNTRSVGTSRTPDLPDPEPNGHHHTHHDGRVIHGWWRNFATQGVGLMLVERERFGENYKFCSGCNHWQPDIMLTTVQSEIANKAFLFYMHLVWRK